MKKRRPRRLKPLFFRILGGIVIPMVILLATFTFVILKREFEMQQRYYEREGKMALETFHQEFTQLISDPSVLKDPSSLMKQIRWITTRLDADQIDVIDPMAQTSLLQLPKDPSLKNKRWAFSKDHMGNIQKSLALKRDDIPYYTHTDKSSQKIFGYLPFRDTQKNRMYAAIIQFKLSSFKQALDDTIKIITAVFVLIMIIGFFISYGLTIRIIRPLQAINRACHEMLAGKLGHQVRVRTGDELELLASNFNKMSQALLMMTHRAEDSNPLTQLPGNREIATEVSHRIAEGRKFIFFHADIDHFKAYNDQYGLSRGDDVLRNTGNLLVETGKEFGTNQDIFVGHQGGDDFVLIVEPSQAETIAKVICDKFDSSLKEFFTKEDLERGYFLSEDTRTASMSGETEIKRFPLMSISLAGVSNVKHDYRTFQEILERAVGVKKRAKKLPYSVHLIDE